MVLSIIITIIKNYIWPSDRAEFGILQKETLFIMSCYRTCISCSILPVVTGPFLLNYLFVFRIKLLQSKRSDHICIYVDSETKSLKYSSKIRHHCRISSCLKSHMERWLQIVLEYNHEKRGINVEQNVLLMLTGLLRKKIVTLFSVYTFEFYYYEINEYTVISTLKDWICRDTKVHARELMLLFPGRLTDYDDNDLVINVWNEVSNYYNSLFYKLPEMLKM